MTTYEAELIAHYTQQVPAGIEQEHLTFLSELNQSPTIPSESLTAEESLAHAQNELVAGNLYYQFASTEQDGQRRTKGFEAAYKHVRQSRDTLYAIATVEPPANEQLRNQAMSDLWTVDQVLYAAELALGRTPEQLPVPPDFFGGTQEGQ
ncbi:hypothetical protein [Mycobacteroides abscessus]|uniref:hypothetical protein n=1 Tax=Mycobacteroides abscessus TaxID=36809 RepID=UPI0009A7FAAB|nr:hypothetical protein [Mycobacteroides abscessus]SLH39029.1 Uncharacterised protein [Mycobacteroides abscessus subsp. massiliense]